MTAPFRYPAAAHVRRHGPQGYADYAGFRDWVRDEFAFCCVYCRHRERWVPGGFHLDHFRPVAIQPDAATDYDNLLYACGTCNARKHDFLLPDPTTTLLSSTVAVEPDGSLTGATADAVYLIEHLGLNRPKYCEFRRLWLRIVALATQHDASALPEILGFPDDLPDLKVLRPPGGNTRPAGLDESYFEQRRRGTLPATY